MLSKSNRIEEDQNERNACQTFIFYQNCFDNTKAGNTVYIKLG